MLAAGPRMADDNSGGIGSLTVLDADVREVAARFAEAAPCLRVGLCQSVRMCRWKQTIRDGKRIVI